MKCQNCGSDIRNDATFCTNCGTRIDIGGASAENDTAETTAETTPIEETTAETTSAENVTVETTTVENVIPETGTTETITETVTTTTVAMETEKSETFAYKPIAVDPQAPCVSSIPAPPQMPDLPANPVMPTDRFAPINQPVQVEGIPPNPDAYAPPMYPPGAPSAIPSVPPGAPSAAPGGPTGVPMPQVSYTQEPGQQYYQQPYQPPGAPAAWGAQPPAQAPWVPPPPTSTVPKKANKGLIIGLIAGGVVLIAAAIVIGIFVSRLFYDALEEFEQAIHDIEQPVLVTPEPLPQPTAAPVPLTPSPTPDTPVRPTPPPSLVSDNELVGMWELDYGAPLWFFGRSEFIMIIEHEDGTFNIFESGSEEWGLLHIIDDESWFVEGDWSGDYDFTYKLNGNRLTIIDIDGDEAHFNKME